MNQASRRAPVALMLGWAAVGVGALGACGDAAAGGGNGATGDSATVCSRVNGGRYVAGLEVTSDTGAIKVKLIEVEPAPPNVGDNTWNISLTDKAGKAVTGAKVRLRPFMVHHGHGTTPAWHAAKDRGRGQYAIGPFHLMMPGMWRHTLAVEVAGKTHSAVYWLCLEG